MTLRFDVPTRIIAFGVALNTADDLVSGAMVELFDAGGNMLASAGIDTTAESGELGFSEGRFSYDSDPVARMVLRFSDSATQFAVDNLVYEVPEPTSVGLSMSCLLIGLLHRRRHRPMR